MVQQPEVRVRCDDVPGRHKGGGQIQEQRPDHQPEEEAPVPHQVSQVPREDRGCSERGSTSKQDRASESGHSDLEDGDRAWQSRAGGCSRGAGEGGFGVGSANSEAIRSRLPATWPGEVTEQGDT
ncbi:uncharacterized protein LOC143185000 [Calliopsis andreniformis]|uniref:uncharacterized protein LOC143185000 n=1 Tax=Calliopsis andreniformis TaxID=337506 RepID=UPI003FCEC84C